MSHSDESIDALIAIFGRFQAQLDSRRWVAQAREADADDSAHSVIAMGKLAVPMAAGWIDGSVTRGIAGPRRLLVLYPRDSRYRREADWLALLAAAGGDHARLVAGAVAQWQAIGGEHPEPGEDSLRAGRALLDWVRDCRRDERVVVLLSGGASALVEWPNRRGWSDWSRAASSTDPFRVIADSDRVDANDCGCDVPAARRSTLGRSSQESGRDPERIKRLADGLGVWTRDHLASGASIVTLNAARRARSAIKGGGLGRRLLDAGARPEVWLVADVPVEDEAAAQVVGSAPCWVTSADDDPQARIPHRVLASGMSLARAATAFEPWLDVDRHRGVESERAMILSLDDPSVDWGRSPPNTMAVAVGERPVRLPERPGRGGRVQHLALQWALDMRRDRPSGESTLLESGMQSDSRAGVTVADARGWLILWASDGFDGSGDAAGVVLPHKPLPLTLLDAARAALARADSHGFWRRHAVSVGARLLSARPTATNQMDLALFLPRRWESRG
ncbi:MAG: DUF4147 domain-containing protein [Thioalkalivibrionaceae bacterium]